MLVKKMGLSWIVVSDLQKAKDFCVNVMGFEVHQEIPGVNYLQLKCGDSLLAIYQPFPHDTDNKPGQNAVMTFVVEDIESAKKVMEAQGIQFIGDIVESRIFKVAEYVDADNNKFQLYQMPSQSVCHI